MAFRGFLLLAAIALMGATPARAQQDAAMRAAAQVAGDGMFTGSGAVGMVLTVVRGNDSFSQGFGHLKKVERDKPEPPKANGKTIVRLGSISKAMTGQILGSLTNSASVRLNLRLDNLLPRSVKVPDYKGRPITLLDLATHTAGLPRDIDINLDGVPGNPYDRLTPEVYYKWLSAYTLGYAPGTVANYSNVGFSLLGQGLALSNGSTFGELLDGYVASPLKMIDTVVKLRADQTGRFMTGYDSDNTPDKGWDGSEMMQPSGGVFSTADDMGLWLKYNLNPTADITTLDAAVAQAVYVPRQRLDAVIALDAPGRPLDGIGLGWEINFASGSRPLIIQKTGAFSGFMAYVAFAPGRDVGVFFAVNRLDFAMYFQLLAQADNLIAGLATR